MIVQWPHRAVMQNRDVLQENLTKTRWKKDQTAFEVVNTGSEISEQQWNRIRDQFPPERKPQGGRPGKSSRIMLNAILYCVLAEYWNTVAGSAGAVRAMAERIQPVPGLDKGRGMGKYPHSSD